MNPSVRGGKRVRKRINKLLRNKGGFTLLELVIVLAVMGFLVAMIAPRIMGLDGAARSHSAEANAQRIEQVVSGSILHMGYLPGGLTNLVSYDGTNYHIAGGTDSTSGNPINTVDGSSIGQNVFSQAFLDNNNLTLHALTNNEILELASMGITHLYNLNYGAGMSPRNERVDLLNANGTVSTAATGLNVLMVGDGSTSTAALDPADLTDALVLNNPEYMYRIVLGIGPESEFVKWKVMDKDPVLPGMDAAFDNYCVLLPRLQSTLQLVAVAGTMTDPIASSVTFENEAGKTKQLGFALPTELGSLGANSTEGLSTIYLMSPDGSKLTRDDDGLFAFDSADIE